MGTAEVSLMKTKCFHMEDQRRFAELTGDQNPFHLDEAGLRSDLVGDPVVHGLHLVFWGLEAVLGEMAEPCRLIRIDTEFLRSVSLNESVKLTVNNLGEGEREVAFSIAGRRAATLSCQFVRVYGQRADNLPRSVHSLAECRERRLEDIVNLKGQLALWIDTEALARSFPFVNSYLPPVQAALLSSLTRLVGMECPGLHSVFSSFELYFDVDPKNSLALELNYNVESVDARFSLIRMNVFGGGAVGKVACFFRPPTVRQITYEKARSAVEAGEFRGQRAIIIGGSRGLGELTAKLLSAGDAQVILTYCRARVDAERVVEEISSGGGSGRALACDIHALDPFLQELAGAPEPSHIYYFATPRIFCAQKRQFSENLFNRFCAYYVTGFAQLTLALLPRVERLSVFYPSSIALEEMRSDMGEYAAAKSAGEQLCSYLCKTHDTLYIATPRLPRLDTDQTATIMRGVNQAPLPVMLDCLRSFRDERL